MWPGWKLLDLAIDCNKTLNFWVSHFRKLQLCLNVNGHASDISFKLTIIKWFTFLCVSGSGSWIYVVDSLDRERIGKAKAEFQAIIKDPFMLNSVILVFANKQDMKGAMTPMEVCEGLGLYDLKNRKWHIQGTCALRGDGLYEGLDWLAGTLKELKATGYSVTVGTSSF
ncbi:Small GTPase superfamily [Macleaya cordata]|uniref:Small GTPase superfamily n=1 Tax=Macleaya cordata TaxID=56857 RepID=A0A200R6V8_MACCD|nr:Small GTPase superfamily [Macleaya cordata]